MPALHTEWQTCFDNNLFQKESPGEMRASNVKEGDPDAEHNGMQAG